MLNRIKSSVVMVVGAALLLVISVCGCEAKPTPKAAKLTVDGESPEAKAKFVLGLWAESIRNQDHLSVVLTYKNELSGGLGPKLKNLNLTMVHKISLTRPDQLAVRHQSGSTGFNIVTDGTQSQTWPQPAMPQYVKIEDMPSSDLSALTLPTSLDSISFGMSTIHTPWQFLVFDNPIDFFNSIGLSLSYEGIRDLDGQPTHVVRAKKVGEYIDIYFSDTDPPRMLRSELYTNQSEDRISIVTFTEWRFEPIDPEVFQIPVPGAPMPVQNDAAANTTSGSDDL